MFARALRHVFGFVLFSLAVFGPPMTAHAQWDVAVINPTEASRPAAAVAQPFGLNVRPVESGELLSKWSAVEAEIQTESDILARCRDSETLCPAAAQKFLAVIAEGRARAGRARIGVVNRAVNMAIQPMSDLAQWGVLDRWSAPLTTFTTGRGDCEDYAIAKYVALRESGVAEDDVRLVIVRDLAVQQDHAVLAVRLEGSWLVLDNRWLTLIGDSEMRSVVPLFVFAHDGVKQFAPNVIASARQAVPTGEVTSAAPSALDF